MSLYDLLMTYIMPYLVDLSRFETGEQTFYGIFVFLISLVICHFVIVVPYSIVLWLCRYKRIRK